MEKSFGKLVTGHLKFQTITLGVAAFLLIQSLLLMIAGAYGMMILSALACTVLSAAVIPFLNNPRVITREVTVSVNAKMPFTVRISVRWPAALVADAAQTNSMRDRLGSVIEATLAKHYVKARAIPKFEAVQKVLDDALEAEAADLGGDVRFTVLSVVTGHDSNDGGEKQADTILGFE